jgi:L-arabinose transport system ATP-binding protein
MRGPAYLECEAIYKRFPGVQALDGVSLAVPEGVVHAVLGENGAGKSTLLKILGGAYLPDSGAIRLGGRLHKFSSTIDAIRAGIAVIHQELQLVPEMTVAQNLYLGHLPCRMGLLDKRALRSAAARQLAELEEDIDPGAKVGSLPVAQRQMVEIAKALARNAKVIAFDEPTSSLSSREVEKLFSVIRNLRQRGRVIVYVSHRLPEVFEICDSATVFRDGRVIETFPDLSQVTDDILINRMVGRDIADIYDYTPRPHGEAALEVEQLSGPGLAEPASFAVAQGEVVALFGLVGAGRTELLKLIYSAVRPRAGRIRVRGREVRITGPGSAVRCGIAFCPEDRKKEGIIPLRSVRENINLSVRRVLSRFGILDAKREQDNAELFAAKLDIRTPSLSRLARDLSGGNQQKVVLARWLSEKVSVMLLDEPTRGIDVGAKSEIYAIISELAAQGIGLLVASSELPEALGISDRILVMRQGRIVASLARAEATEELLLRLALPVSRHAGLSLSEA